MLFRSPQSYPLAKTKILSKDHGRIEKREYFLTDDIDWFEDKKEWCGLKAIGMVRSTRIIKDKETVEVRYFISSVTDIKLFAKAVRQHWESKTACIGVLICALMRIIVVCVWITVPKILQFSVILQQICINLLLLQNLV